MQASKQNSPWFIAIDTTVVAVGGGRAGQVMDPAQHPRTDTVLSSQAIIRLEIFDTEYSEEYGEGRTRERSQLDGNN